MQSVRFGGGVPLVQSDDDDSDGYEGGPRLGLKETAIVSLKHQLPDASGTGYDGEEGQESDDGGVSLVGAPSRGLAAHFGMATPDTRVAAPHSPTPTVSTGSLLTSTGHYNPPAVETPCRQPGGASGSQRLFQTPASRGCCAGHTPSGLSRGTRLSSTGSQSMRPATTGSAGRLATYRTDPFVTVAGSPCAGQQQLILHSSPSLAMAPHVGDPVPDYIRALRSDHLNHITDGPTGRPVLGVALDPDNFPFIQSTGQAEPVNYGVVRIKNIPFATQRAEIIAFLGRNSRILNDTQEPVHIIMERVTSKTHDAYVEFVSLHDAMRAVARHSRPQAKGKNKASRLGDRPVDVELSSQAKLMEELFPLATGVFWDGAQPCIGPPNEAEPWNNFKGFVTVEEMSMLVKHVEIPNRSPFSRNCPQRPFECMISTLKKLPWHMAEQITIRQRHAVFKATMDLIRLLQTAMRERRRDQVLTPQLLRRLHTAAMLCPGLTVTMKDDIAYVVNLGEEEQRGFNQPRFADCWRHAYNLAPKPGIPLDVLEWYIAIIREETTRYVNALSLADRGRIQQRARETNGYFGYFWLEVGLPAGPAFDNLSLAAVAALELSALERIFSRAFPVQH